MRACANFYDGDRTLRCLIARLAPDVIARDEARLSAFGAWVAGEVDAQAEYTSRFAPPVLEVFDRDGGLVNRVRYNPLYAAAHREVYRHGIVGLNYGPEARPFLLTFAFGYLLSQADIAIHCPATLTAAVAYVLDRHAPPSLRERHLPGLTRMDGAAATGATWATEIAGGSDLGATTTLAQRAADGWRLSGVKWFASNADCDLALATARPEGAPGGAKGLGLYLVPRRLGEGAPNAYRIRRLKEKLGTRGLATGEIELEGAHAFAVAAPPDGIRAMMAALGFSRIHNAMSAAGVQRRALVEAVAHVAAREAFGRRLGAYPMVRDLVLDLAMQHEAGLALAFEAARAFDAAEADEALRPLSRVATALAKYQTAEHAVIAASRAIEILGGNGYTEAFVTARLLRDGQVLSVWEGPTNIQALELVRLMAPRYGGFEAFEARLDALLAGACDSGLGDLARPVETARGSIGEAVAAVRTDEAEGPRVARRLLDSMAATVAAALLLDAAAADLAQGDGRKLVIARRYLRAMAPARLARDSGETLAQRRFDEIVAGAPLDPAEARL